MTFSIFAPITKVDSVQRLVYGSLASEVVDKSDEVFDYESSKPFVEEWSGAIAKATDGKSVGNLRAMHGKVAAGKFTALECNDQTKSIEVCAKVVDDDEWNKVAEGVYTGFSIGGSYVKKWTDGDGKKRYTAKPSEGSLVDNPCNPDSTFSMVKADGSTELRKFTPPAAAAESAAVSTPDLEQVWKSKDGATFATKALAKAHNDEVDAAAAAAKEPTVALTAAVSAVSAALQKMEDARTAPPEPAADPVAKTEPAAVEKKDFTQDERDKAAKSGEAMADGSFPIANKADLANAIKAFGRTKNKKAVKAHIIKRAKDLDAEDALPESWKPGADKAVRFGDLRKGLYGVCELASLIQQLEYFQQSTEYEAAAEGDNSTLPATIKQNVATLCAALRAMVEEETNELLTDKEAEEFGELLEMSARTRGVDALAKSLGEKAPAYLAKVGARHNKDDQENLNAAHDHLTKMGAGCAMGGAADKMAKAGARHSKADMQKLSEAHDTLKEVGAECPGGGSDCAGHQDDDKPIDGQKPDAVGDKPMADKAAPAADLTKALADEQSKTANLEKSMSDAVTAISGLVERIKKLEAQPVPHPRDRAPVARVVSKTEDNGGSTQEEELAKLMASVEANPDSLPEVLVRLARQNPRRL